ncbi:MAG: PAS domain-containing protein [Synechococcaceae cyanobacterium RL_1_2]|nr:PAS domain-containing protein [Synechococcaceae cyanobacterium RL_1_2]
MVVSSFNPASPQDEVLNVAWRYWLEAQPQTVIVLTPDRRLRHVLYDGLGLLCRDRGDTLEQLFPTPLAEALDGLIAQAESPPNLGQFITKEEIYLDAEPWQAVVNLKVRAVIDGPESFVLAIVSQDHRLTQEEIEPNSPLMGLWSIASQRQRIKIKRLPICPRYQVITQVLGEIIYEHYPRLNLINWRGNYSNILGYNSEEMGDDDQSWLDRVHPADLNHVLQEFQRAWQGDLLFTVEYRFKTKDGRYIWFFDHGHMLGDRHQAQPEEVIGIMFNMGSNHSLLADDLLKNKTHGTLSLVLAANEKRFRLTFEQAGIGIAHVSPQGAWLDVNQKLADLFGYSPAEIMTKTWQEMTHPDDLGADLEKVKQVLAGEIESYAMEKRYVHRDGSMFWGLLSVTLVRYTNGEPYHFISTILDISQRKAAEAMIHRSREFYQILLSAIIDAVFLIDRSGQFTFICPNVSFIFGYDENEISQMDIHQVLGPQVDRIERIQQGERIVNEEIEILDKTQLPHAVLLSMKSVEIHDNEAILVTCHDISDRKEIEEALKRNEERYNLAVQGSNAGLYDWDLQTDTIYYAPRVMAIIGWDPNESISNPEHWLSEIHPKDKAAQRLALFDHLQRGLPYHREYQIRHQQGHYVWLRDVGQAVWNEAGQAIRMVGFIWDITERTEIEEALRVSEERYELAMEGSGAGLWDWDIKQQTTYYSPQVTAISGYSLEDLPLSFMNWNQIIHPDHRQRQSEALWEHLNYGLPYRIEYPIRHQQGHYVWVEDVAQALRNQDGQGIRMAGSMWDISDRKQIEAELQSSRERLAIALKGSNAGVWDINLVTGESYYGPTTRTILGYGIDDPTFPYGEPGWRENIHPDDREQVFAMAERHLQHLGDYDEEFRMRRKDGTYIWLKSSGQGVWNAAGEPIRMAGCLWDITTTKEHQRRLEETNEALAQATFKAEQANQAKSEFLANMSHEIRTPMNAILGFTELLQRQIDDPQASHYLKVVSSSGKSLLAIIDDILNLSKIEAGKLQLNFTDVSIAGLFEEIRSLFTLKLKENNLSLTIKIDSSVPEYIQFDEVRLQQIIINLVGNAIKFTDEGGIKINVFSETIEQNYNLIKLTIEVIDTGIGIPLEQQEIVFDSFTQVDGSNTRRYGGTGLGLSITSRLTEMLGGHIALMSVPNEGTTFTVVFEEISVVNSCPIAGRARDTSSPNFNQIPPLEILVIDDVQFNLDLIRGFFHGSHHQLSFASGGIEGLRLAKNLVPDLILLDLRMPDLDGEQVIEGLMMIG